MKRKHDGNQQGARRHAEGEHGEKTRAAFIEGLHEKKSDAGEQASGPQTAETDVDVYGQPAPGHHRLEEHREQHDRAEKGSEANRHRG